MFSIRLMVDCEARTALRTAADREFHQRVVPQPVEVDGILVSAGETRAITISNIAGGRSNGSSISSVMACVRAGHGRDCDDPASLRQVAGWRRADTRGDLSEQRFAT